MFFSYKHFRKLTAAVTFSADAADAADAAGSYGAGRGAASAEAAAHVSAAVSAPASTLPDVVALANPVSIINSPLTSIESNTRNLRTVTELRALWPVHAMPEGIPLGPFPDMGGLENSLRQWALAQGFDVKRYNRRDAVKSRGERREYVCWNGFKSRKCGVKVTMQRPNQHRHTNTGCKWKVICEESMEGWVCTNMVHSDHNHDLLSQDQLFVANRNMRHIPDDWKEYALFLHRYTRLGPAKIFKSLQKKCRTKQKPVQFLKEDIVALCGTEDTFGSSLDCSNLISFLNRRSVYPSVCNRRVRLAALPKKRHRGIASLTNGFRKGVNGRKGEQQRVEGGRKEREKKKIKYDGTA